MRWVTDFRPVLVLLTMVAGGCSESEPPPPPAPQTYVVRGVVVQMPDPADPATAFRVAHEAIEDFQDGEGRVVGMDAMTMDFPLADGVRLRRISVGNKVELTLRVDWSGPKPMEVTRVRQLLAETELEVVLPSEATAD